MIKLITAIDKNNLIGNKDKMPWHIPSEFKHFRATTNGQALLFGKRTYMGLPGILPNRKIYVLSDKNEIIAGANKVIHDAQELEALFEQYQNDKNKILFIAGGKSIYEQFVNRAEELIISRVHGEHLGDVYLNLDLSNFELVKVDEKFDFNVEYWHKKNKFNLKEKLI